jgi:hypothetical protein
MKPLDWNKLPAELRYLAEPAREFGGIQFGEQIDAFKATATPAQLKYLTPIACRAHADFEKINRWLDEYRMTQHQEAARVYFLLQLVTEMNLTKGRVPPVSKEAIERHQAEILARTRMELERLKREHPEDSGHPREPPFMRSRLTKCALVVLLAYPSWLGMMAVHELGHVLHAWLSGGHVQAVHFGWFEFSRTELSDNPHPLFVAWGGPVWGCLLPWLACVSLPLRHATLRQFLSAFAGFCWLANGAYLSAGAWIDRAGDPGVMVRFGTPQYIVSIAGLAALAGGLYVWHRVETRR